MRRSLLLALAVATTVGCRANSQSVRRTGAESTQVQTHEDLDATGAHPGKSGGKSGGEAATKAPTKMASARPDDGASRSLAGATAAPSRWSKLFGRIGKPERIALPRNDLPGQSGAIDGPSPDETVSRDF